MRESGGRALRWDREFLLLAGWSLGDLEIVPVVELWVATVPLPATDLVVGVVQPAGFAVLQSDHGYWLPGPAPVHELASAVAAALAV